MKAMWIKYKELVMYLIFGVATTLVNWITYSALMENTALGITVSNAIAWIVSVVFAYFTNKVWVFESKSWLLKDVWKEWLLFLGARVISGIFEIVTVPLLYYVGLKQAFFGVEGFGAKMVVSVGVVVLNYIFSKLFIFRKKDK